MIITDFNQMSLEELWIINAAFGFEFIIEDGKITGATQPNSSCNETK